MAHKRKSANEDSNLTFSFF